MIGLLSLAVRAVLLAGFTFGFVVLFEHGPKGFVAGAPVALHKFEDFVVSLKNPKPAVPVSAPEPAPVPPSASVPPPAPVAAPVSAPALPPDEKGPPSAWEQLQSRPIGAGIDTPVSTPFPTNN